MRTVNGVGDEVACSLADALKVNSTLQQVYLGGMPCLCIFAVEWGDAVLATTEWCLIGALTFACRSHLPFFC